MLVTIILFALAAWGVMSIITSIDAKQRRERQQKEIDDSLAYMERENYPVQYRRDSIAAMRERHRFENM